MSWRDICDQAMEGAPVLNPDKVVLVQMESEVAAAGSGRWMISAKLSDSETDSFISFVC